VEATEFKGGVSNLQRKKVQCETGKKEQSGKKVNAGVEEDSKRRST